jgi:hypothetical protein
MYQVQQPTRKLGLTWGSRAQNAPTKHVVTAPAHPHDSFRGASMGPHVPAPRHFSDRTKPASSGSRLLGILVLLGEEPLVASAPLYC